MSDGQTPVEGEEVKTPAAEAPAVDAPAPDKGEGVQASELASLKQQMAEQAKALEAYKAKEEEARQAELSEAEKIAAKAAALDLKAFHLELREQGVPEPIRALFKAAPKDIAGDAASIGKTWAEEVAKAAKLAVKSAGPAKGAPTDPRSPPRSGGAEDPAKAADIRSKNLVRQMQGLAPLKH